MTAAVATAVDPDGRLDYAIADLTADGGWDEAVAGCTAVLHVASPLSPDDPGDPDAMVAVARDGAMRVLEAAVAGAVGRVVMTSAANAASPTSYADDSVTDETLWTDPDAPGLPAYRRSKTLAEQAAWSCAEAAASAGSTTTLTTILPGAVFGPLLADDNLGSVQVIRRLLRGDMSRIPRIGLEVVDVRDLVDIHLRAMTSPAAADQRFIATGEFMWMADIAARPPCPPRERRRPGSDQDGPRRRRAVARPPPPRAARDHARPRAAQPPQHGQGRRGPRVAPAPWCRRGGRLRAQPRRAPAGVMAPRRDAARNRELAGAGGA